jgi:ABC-2 type transport system permease protein
MVWRLLRCHVVAGRNSFVRGAKVDRNRARSAVLASAIIIWGIGAVSYSFFDPFVDMSLVDPAMRVVLAKLPAFAFFGAFWLLMLSGVTVGIQVFYLNPELQLLLSTPVPRMSVFAGKFIQATLANCSLFVVVGAPILFSYCYARGTLTVPFLAILFVTMLAFAALPTAAGVIASFLLMRILPPNRTREMLGALGIALFAVAYFGMSVSVRTISDPNALKRGTLAMSEMVSRPVFQSGPWAWAGDSLSGSHAGGELALPILLLWGLAALGTLLAALLAQGLHMRGWVNAQEASAEASTKKKSSTHWERRFITLPAPIRGVVMKDLCSLRRDMRQLSLFFIPIAVAAVFLVHVQQTPGVSHLPPALVALGLYPILAMISLRLAMSGFIAETRAMWLVLSAPNDARVLVIGKFVYAYMLSLPIALITTVLYALMRGLHGIDWLLCFSIAVIAVAGFCGIGVGASVLFSDFSGEGTRAALSASTRFATFLIQMLYLALISIVVVAGWALPAYTGMGGAPILVMAMLLVIGISAGFVIVPLFAGAARLRKLEWA